jgi:short-subunit dehydrogenase
MGTKKPLALVTGASSGIGEVFARKLFARGFDLILVARRRERLERLASELGGAEVLVADLAVDADLRRVEERITTEPNLEFLANNAGFGLQGRFWEAGLDCQDRMHRVHVIATLRLTHAAIAAMLPRARGSIINVSSVAAFLHNPFSVSYGATKAWINSFTEALYVELKSAGSPIRIQALCPGFTLSEFHDVLGIDRTAIPRSLWMSAEDVVETSLRGLEQDKVIVIPGWRYRWFVRFQQRLPRFARHALALKYGNIRSRP